MMPNEGTVYQNMVILLFQTFYYFPEKKFPSGGGIHDHFRGRQVQGRR